MNVWAKLKCVWLTINPFKARNAPQHTPRLWPFLYPFKDLMPSYAPLCCFTQDQYWTKSDKMKFTNRNKIPHN